MNLALFLTGIILTVVPLLELRGGLPLVILSLKDSSQLWIIAAFVLVVLINIGLIFLIFLFLDTLHHKLLGWKFYNKKFEKYLIKIQKKSHKIAKKEGIWIWISLFFFVAIPLPMTGAYTGTVLAWFLDLDKKKSIAAIALGVLTAGIIIFLATTGIISAF
ncbi:small multi-drug export protein [archaeon]|nr:small multi-drug export protein [archaeon]